MNWTKLLLIFAWVQLIGSSIGWPYTVLLVDTGEPFWVLNLSWYAVWQTAVVMVITAFIKRDENERA